MKNIFLYLLLSGGLVFAQNRTEVYLLDLSTDRTTPTNISQNPGYDNQPSFWDNEDLLYTRSEG